MAMTTKKIRLTLEIDVTVPAEEDHERAVWTAAVALGPTLPGVRIGQPAIVGVEAEDEPFSDVGPKAGKQAPHLGPETKAACPPLGPQDIQPPRQRDGGETSERGEIGMTPAIVFHFGTAFGLWGYSLDVSLNGESQGRNPDLIAVEESHIYAAVMETIDSQAPSSVARREISGVTVWAEEKPSELYLVLREAMFEAYRLAPYLPEPHRYGADRLTPPSSPEGLWTFSFMPVDEFPDLLPEAGVHGLLKALVADGIVQKDQARPAATAGGEVQIAFPAKAEAIAFLKRINGWLSDYAITVAKRRRATAQRVKGVTDPRPNQGE
jgi:hypothetical protein